MFLVPTGLGLDIVGFLLVVIYGHSLFIHMTSDASPAADLGKAGDLVFWVKGDASVDRRDERRKLAALCGVVLVVIGFSLQIVGSIAGILG